MTDNEIIKALELCPKKNLNGECPQCPYYESDGTCFEILMADSLDLINRQKAEIEKLTERVQFLCGKSGALQGLVQKREKEIERLKAENKTLCAKSKQLQSDVIISNRNYEHIKGIWEQDYSILHEKIVKYTNLYQKLTLAREDIATGAVEAFARLVKFKKDSLCNYVFSSKIFDERIDHLVNEWKVRGDEMAGEG